MYDWYNVLWYMYILIVYAIEHKKVSPCCISHQVISTVVFDKRFRHDLIFVNLEVFKLVYSAS